MKTLLLASALVSAPGQPSTVPQYPYASEPQYQYERTDGRATIKCPKGFKPFQGQCRKWRPVSQ